MSEKDMNTASDARDGGTASGNGVPGLLSESARIKFEKRGSLQFISHLDLIRTMKSAMLRAKIPLRYTEGFNPHPKMTFALPLSIGAESVCELLDIKLAQPMEAPEVRVRLSNALPAELKILEVYEPVSSAKFSAIGWAEYIISGEELCEQMRPLLGGAMVVQKRTKSGTAETDISAQIKRWELSPGRLILLLCADSENYLNPEYVAKYLGLTDYDIMRTKIFGRDGVTEFR